MQATIMLVLLFRYCSMQGFMRIFSYLFLKKNRDKMTYSKMMSQL